MKYLYICLLLLCAGCVQKKEKELSEEWMVIKTDGDELLDYVCVGKDSIVHSSPECYRLFEVGVRYVDLDDLNMDDLFFCTHCVNHKQSKRIESVAKKNKLNK
jgi:hypothetical protein